jgi:opacity protein-like surface antigen
MNKYKLLHAAVLLVFTAVTAMAADVTGAWSGQMSGPNGEGFDLTFTFKQAGTKLTGTVAGPQGDPLDISEGKVDGDKLSFTVNFNGMTIRHTGDISGDEIKLTSKADKGEFPGGVITLKRAK